MAAPGERSFCVLDYHTSMSVVAVQRAFRAKYAKDPPTDKTIRACYKQLTETGCLCKQKSSGRPLTAEDDVERVRASFLHSPKKSTRTAAKELSMSKTTVWRVLLCVWCLNIPHPNGTTIVGWRSQAPAWFLFTLTRFREFRWSFPGKGAVQWRSDIPRQRCSKSSQCQSMQIWKPTCLCVASTWLS
jgi:hypothetical protein